MVAEKPKESPVNGPKKPSETPYPSRKDTHRIDERNSNKIDTHEQDVGATGPINARKGCLLPAQERGEEGAQWWNFL